MVSPDAPSEDDSERNGVLSYAAEWHALTHGVYLGLTTRPRVTPPQPQNRDVRKEPHYYRGGYVIGTLLHLAIAGLTGAGAYALATGAVV